LADSHPRRGFWKYYKMLRRAGRAWNHKRLYRVYCEMKLNHRRRAKQRVPIREPQPLWVPDRPNVVWSADFMSDALYHGRRFRTFNVLDDHNREAVAIEIDTSLTAPRIIRVFEQLKSWRASPTCCASITARRRWLTSSSTAGTLILLIVRSKALQCVAAA
jgi:putative transposase